MSRPELTKILIMQTVKRLAKTKPLDKISVGEITETAGINRKTFYYHFLDKQDLICSIFDYDFFNLEENGNGDSPKIMILDEMMAFLYSDKEFYIRAIRSDVQNSLKEHLYKRTYEQASQWIRHVTADGSVDQTLADTIARMLSYGLTGVIIQWAEEGMAEHTISFSGKSAAIILDTIESMLLEHSA